MLRLLAFTATLLITFATVLAGTPAPVDADDPATAATRLSEVDVESTGQGEWVMIHAIWLGSTAGLEQIRLVVGDCELPARIVTGSGRVRIDCEPGVLRVPAGSTVTLGVLASRVGDEPVPSWQLVELKGLGGTIRSREVVLPPVAPAAVHVRRLHRTTAEVAPGATVQPLAIRLAVDPAGGAVALQAIDFMLQGPVAAVESLSVSIDLDENVAIDGCDNCLAGVRVTDSRIRVSLANADVVLHQHPITLVASLRIAVDANAGSRLRLSLVGVSAVDRTGSAGLAAVATLSADAPTRSVRGLPLVSPAVAVVDHVWSEVNARVVDRGWRVRPGEANVRLAVIELTARADASRVRSVMLRALGDLDDRFEVAWLSVWHDVDASGFRSPTDELVASGRFDADNGTVELALGDIAIAPGAPVRLLVAVTLRHSVRDAGTFAVGLASVETSADTVVIEQPAHARLD